MELCGYKLYFQDYIGKNAHGAEIQAFQECSFSIMLVLSFRQLKIFLKPQTSANSVLFLRQSISTLLTHIERSNLSLSAGLWQRP